MRWRVLLISTALLLPAATAPSASAAVTVKLTVSRSPADRDGPASAFPVATITSVDDGGEELRWDSRRAALTVTDSRGVTAAEGCTPLSPTEVTCTLPLDASVSTWVTAHLGAGDDHVTPGGDAPYFLTVETGAGNDTVDMAALPATSNSSVQLERWVPSQLWPAIHVDLGADDDVFLGGPSPELIAPGGGDDRVDGGPGTDVVSYDDAELPVEASLASGVVASDGHGGRDSVAGVEAIIGGHADDDLTGDDQVNGLFGGAGDDTLRGQGANDIVDGDQSLKSRISDDSPDTVAGGAGDDTVVSGGGPDLLVGGPGNDSLVTYAYDGGKVVDCGPGRDTAAGMNNSLIGASCERYVIFPDPANPLALERIGPWTFRITSICQGLVSNACPVKTTFWLPATSGGPIGDRITSVTAHAASGRVRSRNVTIGARWRTAVHGFVGVTLDQKGLGGGRSLAFGTPGA